LAPGCGHAVTRIHKSFLLLFYKKEVLSSLASRNPLLFAILFFMNEDKEE
jgi:hypothetical protein